MIKNISRIVITAALLFAAQSALAATNDYSHYWSFDEGGGRSVNDSRGGGNGALVGSSTKLGWASGKGGTALFFDGAAGTGIALPNNLLTGTQGTLSLWFKLEAFSDNNVLFSTKSTETNSIYTALMVDREGRPQLQFRTTTTGNDNRAQGTKILNKDEWYNLVLVATSNTYRMYVNGEEVAIVGENSGRWFPEHSSQPLSYRIAALHDAVAISGALNGYIDEIKIFSRALSFEEVTALYGEGNILRPTVPLAIRPSVSLTVSEQTIPFGGSIELKWSSTNVDSCSATGAWNGPLELSGSKVHVKLGADSTYGITCRGKGGEAQAGVTITVSPQATPAQSSATTTLGQPILVAPVSIYSRNLSVGSRGDDVRLLQNHLIAKGYLASGLDTAYFGKLTKAAVVKLQQSLGLPATGFFGPMTRAKLKDGQ